MLFLPFLIALQAVSGVHAAIIHFPDTSCDQSKQSLLQDEMQYAVEMAQAAEANVQSGVYYDTFFAESLRQNPQFASDAAESFKKIGLMASGTNKEYEFQVTCDNKSRGCAKLGWIAHMNDNSKIMNFCNKFFNFPQISNTKNLLDTCNMDLRSAQRTRSAIIVHECTHTSYAMLGRDK